MFRGRAVSAGGDCAEVIPARRRIDAPASGRPAWYRIDFARGRPANPACIPVNANVDWSKHPDGQTVHDVLQALSLAGGVTPFAATDAIRILHRQGSDQTSLRFRYSDVRHGRHLEQNILLQSGDTVVVP